MDVLSPPELEELLDICYAHARHLALRGYFAEAKETCVETLGRLRGLSERARIPQSAFRLVVILAAVDEGGRSLLRESVGEQQLSRVLEQSREYELLKPQQGFFSRMLNSISRLFSPFGCNPQDSSTP